MSTMEVKLEKVRHLYAVYLPIMEVIKLSQKRRLCMSNSPDASQTYHFAC
ncbi:hypothetical protein DAI22_11g203085 [Oryza sativa Japonica Group]|nr:hypothetical protein DAI22_11g203085 [Oryza sativa Japonica Group]